MKSIRVKKSNVVAVFESAIDRDALFASIGQAEKIEELRKIKRQIGMLKKVETSLADEIKKLMELGEELIGPDGTIIATYKVRVGGISIDGELLKTKYPAIYEECLKRNDDIRSLVLK